MPVIRDKNGNVVSESRNLLGVRTYAGKHRAKKIDVCEVGQLRDGHGEGQLSILFQNECSFQTNFASFTVLKDFVRRWRNMHGVALTVNGEDAGTVSSNNPKLL